MAPSALAIDNVGPLQSRAGLQVPRTIQRPVSHPLRG